MALDQFGRLLHDEEGQALSPKKPSGVLNAEALEATIRAWFTGGSWSRLESHPCECINPCHHLGFVVNVQHAHQRAKQICLADARQMLSAEVPPDRCFRLTKFTSYGADRQSSSIAEARQR